nr:alpha/beta hydrolase [Deltaproteobacteria bacterium]
MLKNRALLVICLSLGCGDDTTTPADPAETGSTSSSGGDVTDASADQSTGDSSSSGTEGQIDPGEIQEIQIEVGPFVFDARAAGPADGELVLLLHGFPQSSYEWRGQLSALGEAGYHAVAPDQRGYSPGARPPELMDYAVGELVGDVVGIADALGANAFHVVGHDWGAGVAWATAAVFPDRVMTLTALSIPHIDAFDAEL